MIMLQIVGFNRKNSAEEGCSSIYSVSTPWPVSYCKEIGLGWGKRVGIKERKV
jgi:hypothetical protein